jgi:hypothetical protein
VSDNQQTDGLSQSSTGNPTFESAPQRSESQVPEGMRLVSTSEYEQLSRQANNFKGSAPLIDRLVKAQVKTPDDLDRVLGSYKQINDLGVDLGQLSGAFRREEQQEQEQTGAQFDPREWESKISQTVDSRLAAERHESAAERESRLVESHAKQLAGDNASQAKIDAAKRLIEHEIRNGSAQFYDESDPRMGSLAKSYFKPHDEKSFAGVVSKVGALWKELSASEIRDAAKRGTPTPGQGVTGGDGPTTDGKQNRPFASLSREEKLQIFNRRIGERSGGNPMSQA